MKKILELIANLPPITGANSDVAAWASLKNDFVYLQSFKQTSNTEPFLSLALQIEAAEKGVSYQSLMSKVNEKDALIKEVHESIDGVNKQLQLQAAVKFKVKLAKKEAELKKANLVELSAAQDRIIRAYLADDTKRNSLSPKAQALLTKYFGAQEHKEEKYAPSIKIPLHDELALLREMKGEDGGREVLEILELKDSIAQLKFNIKNPFNIVIGAEELGGQIKDFLRSQQLSKDELQNYYEKASLWCDLYATAGNSVQIFSPFVDTLCTSLKDLIVDELDANLPEDTLKKDREKEERLRFAALDTEVIRISRAAYTPIVYSPEVLKLKNLAASSSVQKRLQNLKDPATYNDLCVEATSELNRTNNSVLSEAWNDVSVRDAYKKIPDREDQLGVMMVQDKPKTAKELISDVERNPALKRAIANNDSLKLIIEKHELMQTMTKSITDTSKPVHERLFNYRHDFVRALPALMKHRDSNTMRFIKITGAILGGAILLLPTLGIGTYFFAKKMLTSTSSEYAQQASKRIKKI